jgi:hypothetical protein
VSKIPKAVSKAMDSLTARYNDDGIDRWGKPHEKIENVLPPTAWQLKVIYDFREKMQKSDKEHEERIIKKIRKEINKRRFKDNSAKVRYLYDIGMGSFRISRVLNVHKSTCDGIITRYRKSIGRALGREHNTLRYEDALTLIRSKDRGNDHEVFRYGNGGFRNSSARLSND